MKGTKIRHWLVALAVLMLFCGTAQAGSYNIRVQGDMNAKDAVYSQNITGAFTTNFPDTKFEIFLRSEVFQFKWGKGCYAEVGVHPMNSNLLPPNWFTAMYTWTPAKGDEPKTDVEVQRYCIEVALGKMMDAEVADVWPAYAKAPNAHAKAGVLPEAEPAPAAQKSSASASSSRFSTRCNNMSCVRTYEGGKTVAFQACMNPATMLPMMGGNISNGRGDCSGTDSGGNIYGMGHMPGMN